MSDHFDGRRFFNPDGGAPLKRLSEVLRWALLHKRAHWPRRLDDLVPSDLPATLDEAEVAVTFVGHSTFLLQFAGGLNLLTDPIWSNYASPVKWGGPRRVRPPGLALDALPPVRAVVISHNHHDHLDPSTLRQLQRLHAPTIVAPLGHARLLARAGLKDVVELDWWQEHQLDDRLRVTLTPAQHWSSRTLVDRNRALWGGFWISPAAPRGPRVYFAGDTGYSQDLFGGVRRRLGRPHLSLLPIGIYEPRWFMGPQHMNPDDAVRAHLDLESQHSLGMHFGTFSLGRGEAIDAPLRDLEAAVAEHRLPPGAFRVPRFGETLRWVFPEPKANAALPSDSADRARQIFSPDTAPRDG